MTETFHDLYLRIVLRLKALYIEEEARAMADHIFRHFFDLTPIQKALSGAKLADEEKIPFVDEAVSSLLNSVPLQYVLGKAYFMDLEFDVNTSVLIPRPETEELISLILKDCLGGVDVRPLRILDIGTGSGCIAISLKHYLPESDVTAVDVSIGAIHVAEANAVMNNTPVVFIQADILDSTQWNSFVQYDLIVSNPPYVTHSEKRFMQRNVLNNEPHTALFVPDDDPLIFYRRIFEFANTKLGNNGCLWFEINEMYGNELKNMALNQGFKDVNIIFDIRGKSRFLQCFKEISEYNSNHTNKLKND